MTTRPPFRLNLFHILAVLLLVGVAVYALQGSFTRYLADDYCNAIDARGADIIAVSAEWYNTASGRLAQFVGLLLALGAAEASGGGGSLVVRALPIAFMALWGAALYFLARELLFTLRGNKPPRLHAALLTLALLVAVLAGTPQTVQSLYWLTGILTYTITIPLLLITAAFALRVWQGRSGLASLIPAGVCLLSAALCNEPSATLAAAGAGLGFLAALPDALRARHLTEPRLVWFGGLVLIALVALAILLSAPGNGLRQTSFVGTASPVSALTDSLFYALFFLAGSILVFSLPGTLVVFGVGLLLAQASGAARPAHSGRWVAMSAVALILVLTAFMLPGLVAANAPPPARSFIVPQMLVSIAIMLLGWWMGAPRQRQMNALLRARMGNLVSMVAAACIVFIAARQIAVLPNFAAFATSWDAREVQLRSVGRGDEARIVLAPLAFDIGTANGLETATDQPGFWINACMERYYQVGSVRVSAPPTAE